MNAKEYKALRGQLRATLRPLWETYYRATPSSIIYTEEQMHLYKCFDDALQIGAAQLHCTRIQATRMILHV